MNNTLQQYARDVLKDGLKQCTDAQQLLFKRMYSPGNIKKPIEEVVDSIDADKLDWAMQQVERTLVKSLKEEP